MKVNDIFKFLDNLFPTNTACDFDNVGILVGDKNAEVKNALVTLDCTENALEFAKENGCSLIITHHPVIFDSLKSIDSNSIYFKLIRENISVISMHTNLDIGENGVNDCLCEALGLKNVKPFTADNGYLLKCGETAFENAESFALEIKNKLNTRVKFADIKKKIKKVLVCSGSGGEFINETIKYGFDALVTADVKHHQFLMAKDNGVAIFDAGHFETEDVVINPLKDTLSAEFKNINFITYHPINIKYI